MMLQRLLPTPLTVLIGVFVMSVCLLLGGCVDTLLTNPDGEAFVEETPVSRTAIPHQYIVVFKDHVGKAGVRSLADELASAHGGDVLHTYTYALQGFAARLSDEAAQAIAGHPGVAFVEPDGLASVYSDQLNPPSWGLDRLDQRPASLDNTYTYLTDGAGVTVYLIDTGIRTSHSDFGGRASVGFDAVGDGQNGEDCYGHGTQIAGIVGGATHGVAKGVDLVAVRVFNCSGGGATSQVIAGVDWVTQNASTPAVANMSLGTAASPALDAAVQASVAAGITYTVAAGNFDLNACDFSPAHLDEVLTTSAATISDARWTVDATTGANWGTCVDMFAPGENITSAWHAGDTATQTGSGTSMASAHTAGVAALYLGDHPAAAPATVLGALIDVATIGALTGMQGGSPNRLLFSRFDLGPPANTPPSAFFSAVVTDLSVTFNDLSGDPDGTVVDWYWDFGDTNTSTSQAPTHLYASPGSYQVALTVTDDEGATNTYAQTVIVEDLNTAPTIDAVNVPLDPIDIGDQPVGSVSAAFTDPDLGDTHTCTVDYGDGSGAQPGVVNGNVCDGPGHTYAEAGVYTVTVRVTDDAGDSGVASATEYVVIYDPNGGKITGGGWIDSPYGACPVFCADATGKSNFGFVAKYKNGAPEGDTHFKVKADDFNFKSTGYDWLVITGARAIYHGSGEVNDDAGFTFQVTVIDGQQPGGGGADKFRIKIEQTGVGVIYDNEWGVGDNDDPTTDLGGGNVKIH